MGVKGELFCYEVAIIRKIFFQLAELRISCICIPSLKLSPMRVMDIIVRNFDFITKLNVMIYEVISIQLGVCVNFPYHINYHKCMKKKHLAYECSLPFLFLWSSLFSIAYCCSFDSNCMHGNLYLLNPRNKGSRYLNLQLK